MVADRVAVCQPEFLEDLQHWVQHDRRMARRLLHLMRAILRDPWADVWSRRITQEHRCVVLVNALGSRLAGLVLLFAVPFDQ